MELAYKDVRGKVFKKELGLLESRNKRAKKQRDKQARYMFKGKHGSKSKNKLPCTKRNIKLYGGIELGN